MSTKGYRKGESHPGFSMIHERYPHKPAGRMQVGDHTAITWNESGDCWIHLDADHILADGDYFWGELMTPAQAFALADQLAVVWKNLAPSRRTSKSFLHKPGKNHSFEEQCEGLASVGVRRVEGVLIDGWIRTSVKPLCKDQLRALIRGIRLWARAENENQVRIELGVQ
jgi:hypothetical protein